MTGNSFNGSKLLFNLLVDFLKKHFEIIKVTNNLEGKF